MQKVPALVGQVLSWFSGRWDALRAGLSGLVVLLTMRAHPFLNPFEAALFRYLSKSPRVGLICVKQMGTNTTWILQNLDDVPEETDTVDYVSSDDEPDSLKLERLYHLPDAER